MFTWECSWIVSHRLQIRYIYLERALAGIIQIHSNAFKAPSKLVMLVKEKDKE